MFKRLLVFPLVLLILCGCAKKNQTKPTISNISFTSKIQFGDNEYICDSSFSDCGLQLTIIEPDIINGLNLCVDKSGVTAEFKDLSYKSETFNTTHSDVAQILYDVLNDISNKESLSYDNENGKINGDINDLKYTFIYSPTGLPISLELPKLDLKFNFKNVTIN